MVSLLVGLVLGANGLSFATQPLSVAVLDFDVSHAEGMNHDTKALLTTLLSARLSEVAGVRLVERTLLKKAMEEQALGLTGMVNSQSAVSVGRLVGANVLITGRIFAVSNKLIVISSAHWNGNWKS